MSSVRRRAVSLTPYGFVLPFLLPFGLFFLYPLGRSFYLSFCSTRGPGRVRFTGLLNYRHLLNDIAFWGSVANTAIYVVAFLTVQLPLSLGLALLLDRRDVRGTKLIRLALFSTSLVGPVFVAVVFAQFLNPNHDPFGRTLSAILGRPIVVPWLTQPWLARLAVLLAWWWLSVGFGMIYLLAGLQGVDPDLYAAAAVDGAGPWGRFKHVTLPTLRPVILFLLMVGTVNGFQLFELPYVLMQGPGPGYAGFTVVTYLFTVGFQQGNFGYASAIGWALVLLVGAASVPQWKAGSRD